MIRSSLWVNKYEKKFIVIIVNWYIFCVIVEYRNRYLTDIVTSVHLLGSEF